MSILRDSSASQQTAEPWMAPKEEMSFPKQIYELGIPSVPKNINGIGLAE
jgi:hypothetical protein